MKRSEDEGRDMEELEYMETVNQYHCASSIHSSSSPGCTCMIPTNQVTFASSVGGQARGGCQIEMRLWLCAHTSIPTGTHV